MSCPYPPPGLAITAPGELQTPEAIGYLEKVMGGMVEGASDESLETFRVVA
jgi:arginine/lysine/ornithine decarboxylase